MVILCATCDERRAIGTDDATGKPVCATCCPRSVSSLITTGIEARLRETYGRQCRVCGGELSMQDSRDLVYACSPMEEDPDDPGHLRYKEGRRGLDADNDHYGRSRCYLGRTEPDPWVMALLDERAKLREERAELTSSRDNFRRMYERLLGQAVAAGLKLDDGAE